VSIQRGLLEAAGEGNMAMVVKALEQGADINHKDFDGRTALHFASAEGRDEVVVHLISKGAAGTHAHHSLFHLIQKRQNLLSRKNIQNFCAHSHYSCCCLIQI
jgi:ankyrin repeat protein